MRAFCQWSLLLTMTLSCTAPGGGRRSTQAGNTLDTQARFAPGGDVDQPGAAVETDVPAGDPYPADGAAASDLPVKPAPPDAGTLDASVVKPPPTDVGGSGAGTDTGDTGDSGGSGTTDGGTDGGTDGIGDTGSGTGDGGGDTGGSTTGGGGTGPVGGTLYCENFQFAIEARPVDIVFSIDQSGSMNGEIAQVKQYMNEFAAYISAEQLDFHVILVAADTGTNGICIPPPLAVGCGDSEQFHLVDVKVSSHNALAKIMDNMAGVESFMRPDSLRSFIVITDDSADSASKGFGGLVAGKVGYEDYVFHSIVGQCDCSCSPNTGAYYMQLSNQTGGLNFDICQSNWEALFDALAAEVSKATTKYKLSKTAIDGSVTVSISGQPSTEGVGWVWDSLVNQVVLQAPLPAPGQPINVCYESID